METMIDLIFSIAESDIQYFAKENINRELSLEELKLIREIIERNFLNFDNWVVELILTNFDNKDNDEA